MADEKYDLVFRGELVPGAELDQVKQNLSRLFKMDAARIEMLFSGKAIVLKRGMDMDAAAKYRVAIKKAGARIDTVTSRPKASAPPAKPGATPQNQQSGSAPTAPAAERSMPEQAPQAAPPLPEPERKSNDQQPQPREAVAATASAFRLAPAGGDLLAPDEKRRQPAVNIDTSAYDLRPVGAILLDDDERDSPAPRQVNTQGLNLAPVGADVLKPEERQPEQRVDLDLSQLSIAPPGERLVPPAPPPPPAPNVSNIKLVDQDKGGSGGR